MHWFFAILPKNVNIKLSTLFTVNCHFGRFWSWISLEIKKKWPDFFFAYMIKTFPFQRFKCFFDTTIFCLQPQHQIWIVTFPILRSVNKVLFTNRCRWQNCHPSLLRLVNNNVESIYKMQKTRMKVLPSATVGE